MLYSLHTDFGLNKVSLCKNDPWIQGIKGVGQTKVCEGFWFKGVFIYVDSLAPIKSQITY